MAGFNLITTDNGGLPDFLREMGGYQDEGLGAGIQPRAPKLGITQDKRFTMTKDGQTIQLQDVLTDASGKQVAVPAQMVRVIIVAASGSLTKAWYDKAFEAGSTDAPDCFSNDGKVPAPGVAKPQCSNCAQCPKNAFGSNPVTGRGKACSDRKMIVCVWEGAPDELMTFNVPTMSLQSLQKLDSELRNANIPMQSVLIGLSFDPSVAYPVVKMNPLGFVDKETTMKWKEAAQTAEVAGLLREVEYAAPAATQSPVPNNQIAFGTAGAGQTAEPQPETQVQQPAATEAPKRTRRTKAEMEAARAAEEAAKAAAQTPAPTQQTTQADAALAAAVEAARSNGTLHGVDEEEEDEEEAELLRQLEAKRAAKAAAKQASITSSTTLAPEGSVVAEQKPAGTEAPVTESVTTTAASSNVLDLLSRWKS